MECSAQAGSEQRAALCTAGFAQTPDGWFASPYLSLSGPKIMDPKNSPIM